jgi:hypothetical protein
MFVLVLIECRSNRSILSLYQQNCKINFFSFSWSEKNVLKHYHKRFSSRLKFPIFITLSYEFFCVKFYWINVNISLEKEKVHIAFSRIILWRTSKLWTSVCNITISPVDDFRTFKKPYSSIPIIFTFSCHLSTKTSLFL